MAKKKTPRFQIPESVLSKFYRPQNFRNIVRIAETDLPGDMPVLYALTRIVGINVSFANALIKRANIDPRKLLGLLTDDEITLLNNMIRDPLKYGIPVWLLNRRFDRATGENRHLIGSTLTLQIKRDIERLISLGHWRGIRHSKGLKVRGQKLGRARPRSIIHHIKR